MVEAGAQKKQADFGKMCDSVPERVRNLANSKAQTELVQLVFAFRNRLIDHPKLVARTPTRPATQ